MQVERGLGLGLGGRELHAGRARVRVGVEREGVACR